MTTVRPVDLMWLTDNLEKLGELIILAPPQLGCDLVVVPSGLHDKTPLNLGQPITIGRVDRETSDGEDLHVFCVMTPATLGIFGNHQEEGYLQVRLAKGIALHPP